MTVCVFASYLLYAELRGRLDGVLRARDPEREAEEVVVRLAHRLLDRRARKRTCQIERLELFQIGLQQLELRLGLLDRSGVRLCALRQHSRAACVGELGLVAEAQELGGEVVTLDGAARHLGKHRVVLVELRLHCRLLLQELAPLRPRHLRGV